MTTTRKIITITCYTRTTADALFSTLPLVYNSSRKFTLKHVYLENYLLRLETSPFAVWQLSVFELNVSPTPFFYALLPLIFVCKDECLSVQDMAHLCYSRGLLSCAKVCFFIPLRIHGLTLTLVSMWEVEIVLLMSF